MLSIQSSMFLQKRVINAVEYKYLDHSFRLGDKIQKVSFLIDKNRQDYNEEIIHRIANARAAHFVKNNKTLLVALGLESEKVGVFALLLHKFFVCA